MNDRLSSLLHDSAQRVPAALRHPDDVRRQARRHQRVRRATTVAASALAVALVASVAFAVQTQPDDAAPLPARPGPTASPTPTPTPSNAPSPSEYATTTPPAATTTSEPAPRATVTEIPGSFDFVEEESDRRWRVSSEDNLVESRRDVNSFWALEPCESSIYPTDQQAVSMVSVDRSGRDYFKSLRLALYRNARTAEAFLQELRKALERCKEHTFTLNEEEWRYYRITKPLAVGEDGFVAITFTEVDDVPHPVSHHTAVFRMDNAVFMWSASSEEVQGTQPDPTEVAARGSAQRNATRVCRLVRCGTG